MEFASATDIRDSVLDGKVSATDVARESLRRIESGNGALNVFLQVFADRAIKQA
jgi:Asp-tRNA(Asn)/Glu-tRNA(Gln) amidotransferase A subunit family amidase